MSTRVLLNLRRAERALEQALDAITADTEYLRGDLLYELQEIGLLLKKMERDRILQADRDALLSQFLSEGGLREWLD